MKWIKAVKQQQQIFSFRPHNLQAAVNNRHLSVSRAGSLGKICACSLASLYSVRKICAKKNQQQKKHTSQIKGPCSSCPDLTSICKHELSTSEEQEFRHRLWKKRSPPQANLTGPTSLGGGGRRVNHWQWSSVRRCGESGTLETLRLPAKPTLKNKMEDFEDQLNINASAALQITSLPTALRLTINTHPMVHLVHNKVLSYVTLLWRVSSYNKTQPIKLFVLAAHYDLKLSF